MTGTGRLPHRLFHVMPMLVAATLMLVAAAAQAREMVSVARPSINMRSGPGTRYEALWEITRGYPLQVTGRKGDWLQVRDFENDVGWVFRPLTSRAPHLIVKAKVANVRRGPGTRYRVIGKAEYGEVLRTIEHRRSWVRVRRSDGTTGWVARRLLWGW